MSPTKIHIALLDCDTPVHLVYASRGMYSDIFRNLIIDAAAKQFCSNVQWEFSTYHCVKGELPSKEQLKRIDGLVFTGSASSAYDNEPWIHNLTTFTTQTYINYPQILLFGSCFGHQLIAQALFTTPPPCAPIVTRSPHGWELGIHPITLSPAFSSHFGPVTNITSPPTSTSTLRMQFVHADHVWVSALPAGFRNIGSTPKCAIQGVWQENRVLTYQGHIEFDEFVNRETIRAFGVQAGWATAELQSALRSTEGVDDAGWASGVLVRFFEEGVKSRTARGGSQVYEVENLEMNEKVLLELEVGPVEIVVG